MTTTRLERRLVGGIINTVQAIIDRGGTPPSHEVQRKAASMVADGSRFIRQVGTAHVVTVQGEHDSYDVIYWTNGRGDVTEARCSCPAGKHDTVCAHLLAVLARADADGHPLQV